MTVAPRMPWRCRASRVAHDLGGPARSRGSAAPTQGWRRDLDGETDGDDAEQRDDQRLEIAKTHALQVEDEKTSTRSAARRSPGYAEQQIEADGRAMTSAISVAMMAISAAAHSG
jgi:hypothetical protein